MKSTGKLYGGRDEAQIRWMVNELIKCLQETSEQRLKTIRLEGDWHGHIKRKSGNKT